MTEMRDRFVTSATAQQPTEKQRGDSLTVSEAVINAAEQIERLAPAGRWKSLALTSLEEALMWANKSIYNEKRGS